VVKHAVGKHSEVHLRFLQTNVVPSIQITIPSSRTALSSQINNCTNPNPPPPLHTFLCIDTSDGDIGNISGRTPGIQRTVQPQLSAFCYYYYYYHYSKIRRNTRKIRDRTKQSNRARRPCITLQLVSADVRSTNSILLQERRITIDLNRIWAFCDANLLRPVSGSYRRKPLTLPHSVLDCAAVKHHHSAKFISSPA